MSTTDTEPTCGWCQHYAPGPPCPLHQDQDEDVPTPDAERDERLRGIRQRVEHLTPKPGEWSSDGLYVTDAGWLLAEVARLDRIINGYDRTPAEQRAADAEARVARLDAVATAVRDMHQPKIGTISVPVFDQWDSPTQVQHGCSCGHYAYPCPTVRALDGGAA